MYMDMDMCMYMHMYMTCTCCTCGEMMILLYDGVCHTDDRRRERCVRGQLRPEMHIPLSVMTPCMSV